MVEIHDLSVLSLDKEVILHHSQDTAQILREGKWIGGRFDRNIRLDQPTYGAGQPHAHVYARHKGKLVAIVNYDGTSSHGKRGRLHPEDADALRAVGYAIQKSNVVEWVYLEDSAKFLLRE